MSPALWAFKMATSKICVRCCRVQNPVPAINVDLLSFFPLNLKTKQNIVTCIWGLIFKSSQRTGKLPFFSVFEFLSSLSTHIVNTKGQNTVCTECVCVVEVITGVSWLPLWPLSYFRGFAHAVTRITLTEGTAYFVKLGMSFHMCF